MEKIVKLIIKGILLYTTFIVAFLYVAGIDSIYDEGYFLIATAIVALLIYICKCTITEEELNILLGDKFFNGRYKSEM